MAKVLIPTALRQYADKKDSVELAGSNVGEVLSALTAQFPDLKKQIFNDEGKLRSFVNVYLNDDDIRYLKKNDTPVAAGDTLSIVPSIAGGAVGGAEPPVTLAYDQSLRHSRQPIMAEVCLDGAL